MHSLFVLSLLCPWRAQILSGDFFRNASNQMMSLK